MSLFEVTDVGGVAHVVTGEAMAAGRADGRYDTVCGRHVLAASLTAPDSHCCRPCRQWRAGRC